MSDSDMQRLGRAGGRSTSAEKRRAARLNGAKGGRPRRGCRIDVWTCECCGSRLFRCRDCGREESVEAGAAPINFDETQAAGGADPMCEGRG